LALGNLDVNPSLATDIINEYSQAHSRIALENIPST